MNRRNIILILFAPVWLLFSCGSYQSLDETPIELSISKMYYKDVLKESKGNSLYELTLILESIPNSIQLKSVLFRNKWANLSATDKERLNYKAVFNTTKEEKTASLMVSSSTSKSNIKVEERKKLMEEKERKFDLSENDVMISFLENGKEYFQKFSKIQGSQTSNKPSISVVR